MMQEHLKLYIPLYYKSAEYFYITFEGSLIYLDTKRNTDKGQFQKIF